MRIAEADTYVAYWASQLHKTKFSKRAAGAAAHELIRLPNSRTNSASKINETQIISDMA